VSNKNGAGGLVQLRKSYRSGVVEYSCSQMADKNQVSSKEESLDAIAIKEKQTELIQTCEKERDEHDEKYEKDIGVTQMYPSECPQCKGASNKTVIALGYPSTPYPHERILTEKHTTVEIDGIKSVNEKISKVRKLIKEKRDEIDELMKKYEMPNKNSSKILIINQNYEKHSHIPEMWYERRWRKSAERYALRHLLIDNEIPQMELDLLTAAVQNLEPSSRKRILDAFQQLEQDQMKNTIESYENEMMSVTTNTGIEKIPQPTRMRKTLYDDSMFPLESWWNKIIKQNGPYAKELETLTSELKVLRTKLEDWKIDLREHNFMPKSPCWSKIEYKCEKCKVGINPECLNCKDEYNELEKIKNENTRIVYPLLCVDLPVCNACVTKWGKEAIQQCL